jgi:UDP-3-O-[3-hydroxymyristoyl] glucosamine N-acyltransferase
MVRIQEVIDALGAHPDAVGGLDLTTTLTGAAALDVANREQLSFCGAYLANARERLLACRAGMLIVDAPVLQEMPPAALSATVVRSDTARLDFIRMLRRFFTPPPAESRIDESAVIAASAAVAEGVAIGPLCTVAGEATIGAGSVLHAGVHIYPHVRIGARVTIYAGTVIGADGFGYERNAQGELERFPHVGGVTIEDEVEIGPNVSIGRGTLGDTHIGARARIDALVHVAHNARVGADAAIIAHATLCGSSSVGARAWIGPCALLREGVSVGADAVVAPAAVVTRTVRDGVTVAGSPARPLPRSRPSHA